MGQKIEKFGNKPGQRVEIFLYQLELSLHDKPDDAAKISELVMSLEGQPLKWVYETMKRKVVKPTFSQLGDLLKAQYAKRKTILCTMTPGMTPEEYIDAFDEALADIGTIDEAKSVEFFNNGVDAKFSAFMHTARCTTLDSAKELLIRIASSSTSTGNENLGFTVFRSTLKKLSDEDREKCIKEGRCFRCRQQGHLSRECPKHQNNLKSKGQH